MAKLDAHKQEILDLLEDGVSQAEIIRYFDQQRGVKIPRSTLSDFVRQQQDDDLATATLEDEGLGERMAAALSFQRAAADELLDRMVDIVEGLQQLKREGDERHTAIQAAIGNFAWPHAAPVEDIKPLLEDALKRLDKIAARTGEAGLRWVWLKALGITGLIWGALLAACLYGSGLWPVAWATLLMD